MSLPVRGEWIEIAVLLTLFTTANESLPVRGEWIEIRLDPLLVLHSSVSPREGRVD